MKPSNIIESLKVLFNDRLPVFIWGAPGIGKSDIVRQVTKDLNTTLIDLRVILFDPVDLRGLPVVDNKTNTITWYPPSFFPKDGHGILFLDELNAAPPLVQAACYQLILDRKLGEYTLPINWVIVAAGNREGDRAVTSRMPSPLANRFVHLDFTIDIDDWCKWAINNNIAPEIIAFIRFRPELLHKFDPHKNEKSFPTPRTYEYLSKVYTRKPSNNIEYDLYKGIIGEGAAIEFIGFLRIFRDLPNVDSIFLDPFGSYIPKDPATIYALCGALGNKVNKNNIDKLVIYLNRLPIEFSVMTMKDIITKDKYLKETRAYIDWVSKNQDVLI